jgi:hypothetical protein
MAVNVIRRLSPRPISWLADHIMILDIFRQGLKPVP